MEYTQFDLIKTANQKFNTNIGDNNFELDFRTFRRLLYATISINGEIACAGVLCTPNKSIFPSSVNNVAGGVFAFQCLTDDYPSFDQFDGITCRLCFCTFEELNNNGD